MMYLEMLATEIPVVAAFIAALYVVYSKMMAQVMRIDTKASIAIERVDDNTKAIQALHKEVNSQATRRESEAKAAADEKEWLTVRLARIEGPLLASEMTCTDYQNMLSRAKTEADEIVERAKSEAERIVAFAKSRTDQVDKTGA